VIETEERNMTDAEIMEAAKRVDHLELTDKARVLRLLARSRGEEATKQTEERR
jgi:hypothetical protein